MVSTYWPRQVMHDIEYHPRSSKLAHMTAEALKACDANDGVLDDIISLPDLCTFTTVSTVGDTAFCKRANRTINHLTAVVANATWAGIGFWPGLSQGALLEGMANTICTNSSDASCASNPFAIAPWIPYFIEKDSAIHLSNMSLEQYQEVYHKSVAEYQYIIGTSGPDLSAFRAAGGKMITTHGLDDPVVFPNGTRQYYESVLFFDKSVQDFTDSFRLPA